MERAFSGQHSAVSQNEAFSNQHSAFSQNQDQDQKQKQTFLSPEQRAEALVRRIGEACDELERMAEENPELVGRVTHGAEEHKEAYLRLKARLALADSAPRCRWVRQDGTTCGSPQMKRHIYCFAHKQLAEAQALALRLPALEDANAIQVGIMRIQKALIEGTISTKTAGLLLSSMQLALQNVGQTTFGQAKAEEPVTETVDAEDALREKALSSRVLAISQNQPQNQEQTFETQRNGGSGGAEDLPLMDEDDRGLGSEIKPVVWRPTPDMYRTDTPEGREAYEACLRMTMAPQMGAERRPVQHANLG